MDVLADVASVASESSGSESSLPHKKGGKKTSKKPQLQHILMRLLNDESAPDAIWWLPGEKEFAINANRFPAVLDLHLPGTKYASFIRRLHKLGFSRQTRSLKKVYGALPEHTVAFRHDKFVKDKPELLDQLKNGCWKEAKARKARGGRDTTKSRPPASVEVPSPVSFSSDPPSPPPETLSMPLVTQKPVVATVAVPTVSHQDMVAVNAELLRRQQMETDRNLQLILLRQRVAQEQAEMEQLLALRQQQEQEQLLAFLEQQQQEQVMAAAFAAQQAAAAASAVPEASQDVLFRLQLLQQLQQQQVQQQQQQVQPQQQFNPYLGNHGWY